MKSDLYVIRQLEKEISKKVNQITQDKWSRKRCTYVVDKENMVISLNLEFAGLNIFPMTIFELEDLKNLRIPLNFISQLPPEIVNLKSLQSLYLGGNQLKALPPEIGRLSNLQLLSLSGNYLNSLPIEFAKLKNLKKLSLRNNRFTSFPIEILELDSLEDLDLRKNKLSLLPKEINGLKYLEKLSLDSNPIEIPPPEIVKRGKNAIFSYFQSFEKDEVFPLNEVKVLLVGDGSAGKTSLIKRICGESFEAKETQTHGINIKDWQIEEEGKTIHAHFWDFGGQEIYHATHQLFLSERSLYILVLDGRKDEKTEYWLKHIESFGGDSPIMVVLNKIDENPAFDVNRSFLKQKYRAIKEFHRVSCATGDGIEIFSKSLGAALMSIEMLQITWPKNWFNVKTKMEQKTNDFMSYDEYQAICVKEKITEKSDQETLVDFLNDLGIMLHFKDFELKFTHVLEPRWITNAVYKLINSQQLSKNKGILSLNYLDEILIQREKTDYYYPRDKYKYLIDVMKKFELCYRIDNETILIPDLLAIQEPEFYFDYETSLKFIIEYDFLPRSVMPRFIVRMNKDIKNNLCWRTGVVLEDEGFHSMAVVKSDNEAKKIYIDIIGEQKRDYCSIIRKVFRDINGSFKRLEAVELVPLPDNSDFTVDYQELVGHEQMKESWITIGTLRKKYMVKHLLDGIEREEERAKKHLSEKNGNMHIHGNVTINQRRAGKVSNYNIKFGNGATIHDLVIAKKIEDSFNKITYSNTSNDLKELLKNLTAAVAQMSEKLSEDEAKEVADDLEKFATEAIKEKPRQKWLELSAEGLKEAAKSAGKLGASVLQNLDKILPILGILL